MKKYQFSQNRLLAKFEAPKSHDRSDENAGGKAVNLGESQEFLPRGNKEKLESLKNGLQRFRSFLEKQDSLRTLTQRVDELTRMLGGQNPDMKVFSKKLAEVAKTAKEKFIGSYKEQLIKKNPGMAKIIGPAFDVAVGDLSARLDSLIDDLESGQAEASYDDVLRVLQELEGLADIAQQAESMIDLPPLPDVPFGPDVFKTY